MNGAAEYRKYSPATPGDLVARHAEMVRRIALHLAARLPACVDVEDLCQAGIIGLLEAAQKFDPSAGASFETFAGIRIRGAMIDELRKGDWAPRSVHRGLREAAEVIRALEQETGLTAREADVAERLGLSLEEYRKLLANASSCNLLSMEMKSPDGEESQLEVADADSDHVRDIENENFKGHLAQVIDSLPEREKLVLSLYYSDEMNLKEIGAVIGVSESRVCQIHGQAVLRIRTRLQDEK